MASSVAWKTALLLDTLFVSHTQRHVTPKGWRIWHLVFMFRFSAKRTTLVIYFCVRERTLFTHTVQNHWLVAAAEDGSAELLQSCFIRILELWIKKWTSWRWISSRGTFGTWCASIWEHLFLGGWVLKYVSNIVTTRPRSSRSRFEIGYVCRILGWLHFQCILLFWMGGFDKEEKKQWKSGKTCARHQLDLKKNANRPFFQNGGFASGLLWKEQGCPTIVAGHDIYPQCQ